MTRNEIIAKIFDLNIALAALTKNAGTFNETAIELLRADMKKLVMELSKFENERMYEMVG